MKKLLCVLLAALMLCGGFALLAGAVDTYTLIYDCKGAVDAPGPFPQVGIAAGTTVTLSAIEPAREGYSFLGWSATDGGTTPITSIVVNNNTTVYAIWVENPVIPGSRDKIYNFLYDFFLGAAQFANFATWIVRYIFFGWLWGQWL